MVGRLLTRYIVKEILQVFLFTLSILTLIFFVIFSSKMVQEYSQYISLLDILLLTPYTLALSASMTIPLALLAATTMVYGRMASEKEILILRIAGVHFHRMFQPTFVLGILLCGVCFYINGYVVPLTLIKQKELKYRAVDVLVSASFSAEGMTIDFIPEILIYYRKLEQGRFYDLNIKHIKQNEVAEEVQAQSGYAVYDRGRQMLTFHLENVTVTYIPRKNSVEQHCGVAAEGAWEVRCSMREEHFYFKKWAFPIPIEDQEDRANLDRPKFKTFAELHRDLQRARANWLAAVERSAGEDSPDAQKNLKYCRYNYVIYLMEWHRRLVGSLISFLVVFLGAPLGILVRHNNRLVTFGAGSLPVLLIYYPLQIWGRAMVKNEVLSPFWGEWLASIVAVFLAVCILIWVYRK